MTIFGPAPRILAHLAAVVYGFRGFTLSAERRGKDAHVGSGPEG
jgi:hypothetical protein